MHNEIEILQGVRVRTIEIDDELFFIGKDVAAALGYKNTKKALADHVDADDKRRGDGVTICDALGRNQNPVVINESGLYSLIFRSRLPEAQKFRRWVTHEVLPSIRKYGMYIAQPRIEDVDIDELIAAISAKEGVKRNAITE